MERQVIKMNFRLFDNLCTTLCYQCVDTFVHGSDQDVRDMTKKLSDFRDFLDLVLEDMEAHVKESEEKNA